MRPEQKCGNAPPLMFRGFLYGEMQVLDRPGRAVDEKKRRDYTFLRNMQFQADVVQKAVLVCSTVFSEFLNSLNFL
jgi:hypothetical protein